MPRTPESLEEKILRYFREAPLANTALMLRLIKAQARPAETVPAKVQSPTAAPKKAHHKKATPAKAAAPAAPAKKSHHKQKPAGAPQQRRGSNGHDTEVESFSLPERD